MKPPLRLARPLYEGLPWVYAVCGGGALIASYFAPKRLASVALGLPGFVGLLAGLVIILRRRDYRRMRRRYQHPDALAGPPRGEP